MIEESVPTYEIPELEVPDDDVRYCLGFLQPILTSTIDKLYDLGKPGWGGYLRVVFEQINDVMASANEQ